MDNIRLEAIQESQAAKIRKLEATLKMTREEMKEVDEGRIKVAALKAVEDFQTSTEFLIEKHAITSKAMEDFQASEGFCDEKVDFTTATYEGMKDAREKVIVQCPGQDLSFLDELLAFEEGEVLTDASKDTQAFITTDASQDASASTPQGFIFFFFFCNFFLIFERTL